MCLRVKGNESIGPKKSLSMRQALGATGKDLQIPKVPPELKGHH